MRRRLVVPIIALLVAAAIAIALVAIRSGAPSEPSPKPAGPSVLTGSAMQVLPVCEALDMPTLSEQLRQQKLVIGVGHERSPLRGKGYVASACIMPLGDARRQTQLIVEVVALASAEVAKQQWKMTGGTRGKDGRLLHPVAVGDEAGWAPKQRMLIMRSGSRLITIRAAHLTMPAATLVAQSLR